MRSNFHEGTAARGRGGPGSAASLEADAIVLRGCPAVTCSHLHESRGNEDRGSRREINR